MIWIALASYLIGQAQVIDGDTIRVGQQAVRLWGIDAAELWLIVEKNGKRRRVENPAGKAAKAVLVEIIESAAGELVVCEPTGAVSWNRIVAVCRVGGLDLGAEMIRRGAAKPSCRFAGTAYDEAAREGGVEICEEK